MGRETASWRPPTTRRARLVVLALVASVVLVVPAPEATAQSVTITVTSTLDTNDANPGDGICDDLDGLSDGPCSLRAAVEELSQQHRNGDITTGTIVVPAGGYLLTKGPLAVADDLTLRINGDGLTDTTGVRDGADHTTVDARDAHQIFTVADTAALELHTVRLTGGYAAGNGGAIEVTDSATLQVSNAIIDHSHADGSGGAIHDGNSAQVNQGSLLLANSAGVAGGAISSTGSGTAVQQSALIGNSAPLGGGYYRDAAGISISLSTIALNTADQGGGVYMADGILTGFNMTISANHATTEGGGIFMATGGGMQIARTIISGNTADAGDADCVAAPHTGVGTGPNLLGEGCVGKADDIAATDPLLGPYMGTPDPPPTDLGGNPLYRNYTTAFLPPLLHSPALDAVDTCPPTDQVGTAAPVNGRCDIGAIEHPEVTIQPQSLSFGGGQLGGAFDLDDVPAEQVRDDGTDAAIVAAPLREVIGDPQASPLAAIPLAAIPLAAIDLAASPLAAILLPDLVIDGGWEPLLAGTDLQAVPPQNLTLGDALADPTVEARFNALTIAQVDLAASPLAAIPLAAIALGAIPLAAIQLNGAASGTAALTEWCAALAGTGHPCSEFGIDPTDEASAEDVTLTALALAGVPLAAIPLAAIPLAAIDLTQAPLAAIPLAAIDISGTPLAAIPLAAIDLQATPLAAIPLAAIPLAAIPLAAISTAVPDIAAIPLAAIDLESTALATSPLAAIPLAAIPVPNRAAVVDCTKLDCNNLDLTLTLGQLADADHLDPNAELTDIGDTALADFRLADLLGVPPEDLVQELQDSGLLLGDHAFDVADMVLGELGGYNDAELLEVLLAVAAGALADVTLADLLFALAPGTAYPWEDIDLDAADVVELADGAVASTMSAGYMVEGLFGPTPFTMSMQAPAGYAFVDGTATLKTGSGAPVPVDAVEADDGTVSHTFDGQTRPLPYYGDPGFEPQPTTYTLAMDMVPGHAEGPSVSASTIDVGPYSDENRITAFNLQLFDPLEPNDTVGNATPAASGVGFSSIIESADDVDLFAIDVPQDARLSVSLDHLPADYDVVVYGPPPGTLRDEPESSIIPVEGEQADLLAPETEIDPHTTGDVPLAERDVLAVSRRRGTGPERLDLPPAHVGGPVIVQVNGHDGAYSDAPYLLRLKTVAAPAAAPCVIVPPANDGQGAAVAHRPPPGALDPDTNTLFLVASERLGDHFGTVDANQIMAQLHAVATSGINGVRGEVVSVDSDPAVANAYLDFDIDPCRPEGANPVVAAIGDLLDDLLTPAVEHLVLIGDDTQIPFARMTDVTSIANERGYASTLADRPHVRGNLAAGTFLSDDPYGDAAPIQTGDRQLFVPDIALGRLVETPDQILGALQQFIDFDGRLDPTTGAAAAGYDFLDDGTEAVRAALVANGLPTTTLTGDSWTRADLIGLLGLDGSPAPGVASIAAHFDHARALPAAGNATGDESDLFTVDDINDNLAAGALLFSMGCHSGLSVSDARAGELAPDWAQTLSEFSAAAWVANTGYAYGDTEIVAYTESLMAGFAANLDGSMTIGQALQYAKHAYLADVGIPGVYDEKVLQEAVLYGLPMYELARAGAARTGRTGAGPGEAGMRAGATPRATSAVATVGEPTVDPISGLDVQRVVVDLGPDDLVRTATDRGDYWMGPSGVEVTNDRPVMPRATIDVSLHAARGALITGLTSTDIGGVDPVVTRPTVDLAANEPETPNALVGTFPSGFQRVTTAATPDGDHATLVLVPGQYVAGTELGAPGTQRLFTDLSVEVFSPAPGAASDITPPEIVASDALVVGGGLAFRTVVSDDVSAVERVLVLYTPLDAPGEWTAVELTEDEPGVFTGGVPDHDGGDIGFITQALDGAGNVAVSSDKGALHQISAPAPTTGDLQIVVSGPGNPPLYSGPVDVTLADNGFRRQLSLDGSAFAEHPATVAISGQGPHRVLGRDIAGNAAHADILIDTEDPTVTISVPADGSTFIQGDVVAPVVVCTDAGTGVEACDTPPVDTSAPGEFTYAATAVDGAGRSDTTTVTYTVEPAPPAPPAPADPGPAPDPGPVVDTAPPQRVAGTNRYGTAAVLSTTFFDSPDTVYVASGETFADALVVGSLAGSGGAGFAGASPSGPVLLVERDRVPAETRDALAALAPSRIVIIGGTAAVADEVAKQLVKMAARVDRLAGANRFETAAAVALDAFGPSADTLWLATGQDYPDGLTASAAAGGRGEPMLLTARDVLPAATVDAITALAPREVILVGGTAAISEEVARQVGDMAGVEQVTRIAGDDRYATAALISQRFDPPADRLFVATGLGFADALAVGPVAASGGHAVVLTRPDDLPTSTADAVSRLAPVEVVVVGGAQAVADSVVDEIDRLRRE